eukprot:TRINITY_DN3302_c0_g1_i2.p1 TRINITY_DN3302_c0_g1~~TRINITY_DN3302_c0_g1_i2.p1  ORF type:complete len:303 (+),score=58.19 TRINITY_DN3302_c0_g1_i2:188-1096(+)
MISLIIYEIAIYTNVELIETISVDESRNTDVSLHLDITFHEMECDEIHFDVVDVNNNDVEIMETQIKKEKAKGLCRTCHQDTQERCCTCEDVKAYYVRKSLTGAEQSFQCVQNIQIPLVGCRVVTHQVKLPKIGGNFHVAPGRGTSSFGGHTHSLNPFTFTADLQKTRLSHTINHISFGAVIDGMVDPLRGATFLTDQLVRHVYYLRLVPTFYHDHRDFSLTNQYSVTNHTDVLKLDSFSMQLPGVFFKYDFSPMLVKLERKQKYFTHFLTRLCAVIGGLWVVLGLVYQTVNSAVNHLKKKH